MTTNTELSSNETTDIDGLILDGVREVSSAGFSRCLEVTVQRKNSRVTRVFEGAWEAVYDQCIRLPNVLIYEIIN
jgi:hypothetical protein